MNAIERDASPSLPDLYHAVSGLTILSEKLSRDKIDKIVKTVQSTLRKDDNLWKYVSFYIGIYGP